jgi:hypothetical protein
VFLIIAHDLIFAWPSGFLQIDLVSERTKCPAALVEKDHWMAAILLGLSASIATTVHQRRWFPDVEASAININDTASY